MHSTINKNWTAIRNIKCKDTAEKYKHLKLSNHIYTDKKEISNIIGQTISKKSSKDNLSHKFIAYKIHKKRNFLISHLKTKNVIMNPLLSINSYSLITILKILP